MTNMMFPDTSDETINMDYNILEDLNLYYIGHLAMAKGSRWKPGVQKFEYDWLLNIIHLVEEIQQGIYSTLVVSPFILSERGHKRLIHGLSERDRTVRHVYCDNILNPRIRPLLIYDNYASLKNRGIDRARKRFEIMLHKFYRKYNSNSGFILIMDYGGYYDNILHEFVKKYIYPILETEKEKWLLDLMLKDSEVDMSFLTDEEFNNYKNIKLKMLDWFKIPRHLKTGKKFWPKSLNIGNQDSQTISTYYPHRIDNFIKIVKGIKFYGRYMDDSYIMARTKEELLEILDEIIEIAKEIGIFLNKAKTKIIKLDHHFKFLQVHYSLTETGKLISKIDSKRVTAVRRRLKAYKETLINVLPFSEIKNAFKSWLGSNFKYMSKYQIMNLISLFDNLFSAEFCDNKSIKYEIQKMLAKLRKRHANSAPH